MLAASTVLLRVYRSVVPGVTLSFCPSFDECFLFYLIFAVQAAGREDSSMNLRQGDMFIVRYRPIRTLVLEGRVDLI